MNETNSNLLDTFAHITTTKNIYLCTMIDNI